MNSRKTTLYRTYNMAVMVDAIFIFGFRCDYVQLIQKSNASH